MAEEEQQDQQAEEKLKVELPGLFGRRKRRKTRSTPADAQPTEPLQPFEDEADQEPTGEAYDDEEPPAPAPTARFTSPGTTAAPAEQSEPDLASTGSTDEGSGSTASTAKAPKPRKPKKARKPLPPLLMAVVVGLFVGVLACGLTYAGMVGCQEIQGTTACGGPGFFVLIAIMVMLVAVGSFLLRIFGVPDPTSTSLLAIGLVAVIALSFLIEVIFAWWMIIVIPLVSAAAYAGSHWLTHVFTSTDLEG